LTPLEAEQYRRMDRSPELGRDLLDVFARRRPSDVLTVRRAVWLWGAALARRVPTGARS